MFTPTRSTRVDSFLTFILFLLISLVVPSWTLAQEKDSEAPVGAVGGAVHADLFTGTATTSIPIEVPPGRQGVQPDLSLVYASGNGNGWVGMGWKLEKSVIERRTKDGLDYSADDYVVRLSGINAELVAIDQPIPPLNHTDFRAKIEGSFTRIHKLTAPDGKHYFEATDKLGKKYRFGYTTASRLFDPSDPSRIFRWCLDYVIDVHGNYMEITYSLDENQGYLAQIDYTGNVGAGLLPTNSVVFHLEDLDVVNPTGTVNPMYNRVYLDPDPNDPNVDSPPYKTAKRLKTVEVLANGVLQRAYKLDYTPSAHTGHSQLSSVQQFGSDAVIDGTGTVLSGTSLPAMTLGTSPESNTEFEPYGIHVHGSENWSLYRSIMADVDGDGLMDSCAMLLTTGNLGRWTVCAISLGDGTFGPYQLTKHSTSGDWSVWTPAMVDVNGDGKADSCANVMSSGWWATDCALSNGDGTFAAATTDFHDYANWTLYKAVMADVDGDGKTDACAVLLTTGNLGRWTVCAISLGDGTFGPYQLTKHSTSGDWSVWTPAMVDVNGDGKADSCANVMSSGWWATDCALSNGDGTFSSSVTHFHDYANWIAHRAVMADVNGDSLIDACASLTGAAPFGWKTSCALGHGDGTFAPFVTTTHHTGGWAATTGRMADINGDGLTDSCNILTVGAPYGWKTSCALSNGDGTFAPLVIAVHHSGGWSGTTPFMVDVNGDGLTDSCNTLITVAPYGWKTSCALNSGVKPFLLTQIDNGLGGGTGITYVPSTVFRPNHTLLPFPVQVVGAISTDDGNGNISTTTYQYEGGYFHLVEREFRGFNTAISVGPKGPNGEQTVNKTWFHQGNDTAVDANTPGDPVGYLKGAPYRTQVFGVEDDGQGNITYPLFMDTTVTYTADADGVAPFYTPKSQEVATVCDGDYPNCVVTASVYGYDDYGNVIAELSYGDYNDPTDDRTTYKAYQYNTTNWLLSFPSSISLYEGILTSQEIQALRDENVEPDNTRVSHADFYYDSTIDCNTASTIQVPTKGLLTRTVKWLNGGTSPDARVAYDAFGNPVCTRDGNGNTETMSYDSDGVFVKTTANALGHVTTTQYYGVDGVLQDNGLYGQTKQVTDPNSAVVSTTYDKLGRDASIIQPDGFTVTKSYVGLGTVGTQSVRTDNDLGLSSWFYFDGLGREIKTENTGPDGKIIVKDTEYNVRGASHRVSLPYFKVGGTPQWVTNTYDPMGRVIRTDNPDGAVILKCYNDWTSVTLDAQGHKTRQVRNVFDKPLVVQEYEGVFATCDTTVGTPYSTTTYQYDVRGNLRFTTDTLGNQMEVQFDTLQRKVFMHDPDMGDWTYAYDAEGNVIQQVDGKGQVIHFQYDALNRVVQKDYGTLKILGSGDVVYTYDGATSNGIGRLTHVADSSGSTTFYYSTKGKLSRSDKVIGGNTYTTQTTYDGLDRITSVTYPDSSVVTQTYNGPELASVVEGSTTHIAYSGFNAFGQPGTATYANGVVTSYSYNPQNVRLNALQTVNSLSTTLMDLNYGYDTEGNITSLIDPIRGNQTYGYDSLDRLTSNTGPYGPVNYSYDKIGNMLSNSRVGIYSYNASGPASVRPHAVTGAGSDSYTYDSNGNMTGGAGRTLTYDFENRPTQITKAGVTTDLVYDGDGGRVMKTVGGVPTVYVGKLYVCENGICSRMIFANGQRIAEVETLSSAPRYYHTDHLGSTGVVTDNLGNNIQDITYYPFGKAYVNAGSADVRYKFTGKELDNSTDLYFYEARYYDPHLGRFVSADTKIPNHLDPQALNRYSYAKNNPVIYTDPSGHFFVSLIVSAIVLAKVAVVAAVTVATVAAAAAVLGGSYLAFNPWAWQVTYQGYQSGWDWESVAMQQGISFVTTLVTAGTFSFLSGTLSAGATTANLTSAQLATQSISISVVAGAASGAVGGATKAALYDVAGKLGADKAKIGDKNNYLDSIVKDAGKGAVKGLLVGLSEAEFGTSSVLPEWVTKAVTGVKEFVSYFSTGNDFIDKKIIEITLKGISAEIEGEGKRKHNFFGGAFLDVAFEVFRNAGADYMGKSTGTKMFSVDYYGGNFEELE